MKATEDLSQEIPGGLQGRSRQLLISSQPSNLEEGLNGSRKDFNFRKMPSGTGIYVCVYTIYIALSVVCPKVCSALVHRGN